MASLEQEILQRVSKLNPENKQRVLDFVTHLENERPLSALELMKLPYNERQRHVQAAIESAADENFETFETLKNQSQNEDDYHSIIEKHISELTMYGRHYSSILNGCVSILKLYYSGELTSSLNMSEHEVFATLVETQHRFNELITWSITERQAIINERWNDDYSEGAQE